jgi:hypothetical protein
MGGTIIAEAVEKFLKRVFSAESTLLAAVDARGAQE